MKRFLILLTALTLILTCTFGLIGCNKEPPTGDGGGGITQAEASSIYKNAAKSAWAMLGTDDPTIEETGAILMSVEIPDFMPESNSDDTKEVLKYNLARMSVNVNFIGDLYANENFVLTDKVVTFSAGATMGDMFFEGEFSMCSLIDKENNKIYCEIGVGGSMVNEYNYHVLELDYNFDERVVTAFRCMMYEPGYVFNDQRYTADEKCYIAASSELELYQESLDAYVADFNQRKADGVFLTERFDAEYQRMANLAAKLG